jgi:HlyD family secretion protein
MTNPAVQKSLFRKTALERLSTPDQLDQLVTISGPRVWMATLCICALLLAVIIWGFKGVIPSYVAGDGLIMQRGGAAFDVVAPEAGRLDALAVAVGDQVSAGATIGTIAQPQIAFELAQATEVLAELEGQYARLQALFAQEMRVSTQFQDAQRRNLLEFRAAATQRRETLQDSLDSVDQLAEGGLVTRSALTTARAQVHQVEQEIRAASTDLIALDREANQMAARHERELFVANEATQNARRAVNRLADRLQRAQVLRAATSGVISEIKAPLGAFVTRGQPVISIAHGGAGLEAVIFLPAAQGKDIIIGQAAAIQPTNIKKEEFGAITGRVTSVSEFPASPERMQAILQNDSLVRQFSAAGPRYVAHVLLDQDPDTFSGLRWSSGAGPMVRISAGSLAAAEITIRERAPVDLVIPALRRYTGLDFWP